MFMIKYFKKSFLMNKKRRLNENKTLKQMLFIKKTQYFFDYN